MSGSTSFMSKMAGHQPKNKKRTSKTKRPGLETLKEEEEEKTARKISKEERKAKEEEEAKKKKFFLNVTYRQFLKYLQLMKTDMNELWQEINKDQEEMERKYAMYLEESEPEDEEDDDDGGTTTSTEYYVAGDGYWPWQVTPRDLSGKGATPKSAETMSTPRSNGTGLPVRSKTTLPERSGGAVTLPRIGDNKNPTQSRSPRRGSKVVPPLLKTSLPLDEVAGRPDDTVANSSDTNLGLPPVKSKTDLDTVQSDAQATLMKSHPNLSDRGHPGKPLGRSTPETPNRKIRRGSRYAFPNLTNSSMSSVASKKRRPSVVPEPDWEQRKLSLQKWASSSWIVVRDTKYPKEVERLKAMEQARKTGEKVKKRQDVPITCQRWKYVPLEEQCSPLRFAVTYSGIQSKKKNPVPSRKKPLGLRGMKKR